MQIIKVLIPKVGLFPLDYQVIEDVNLLVGDLIIVSFRNQNITGIVWQVNSSQSDKKLKTIDLNLSSLVDNCYQNIGSINLEVIKRASEYYLTSLGSVAKLVLPFEINQKIIKAEVHKIPTDHFLPDLSEEQLTALNLIRETT